MELSEYKPNHSACVHFVVWCESEGCAFRSWDYLTALKEAVKHHEDTGHEVNGEEGRAVWVGEQGRRYNKEMTDARLAAMGIDPAS